MSQSFPIISNGILSKKNQITPNNYLIKLMCVHVCVCVSGWLNGRVDECVQPSAVLFKKSIQMIFDFVSFV